MQFLSHLSHCAADAKGRSPQQACEEVVKHVKSESSINFEVGVVAINTKVGV